MAACMRPGGFLEDETLEAKRIEFRTKGNQIIPYIELFSGASKPFPIKSIIVGPGPDQDEQEEAARLLLETNNLEAGIRRSEIPYRK
jgi:hypothetical protein